MLTYLSGIGAPKKTRAQKQVAKQQAKQAVYAEKAKTAAAKKQVKQTKKATVQAGRQTRANVRQAGRQQRIKSGAKLVTAPVSLVDQRIQKAKVEKARRKAMEQSASPFLTNEDQIVDKYQQVEAAYDETGNFDEGIEEIDAPEFSNSGSADSDFDGEDMGIIYPGMAGTRKQSKRQKQNLKLAKKQAKIKNIQQGRPGLQKAAKVLTDTAKTALQTYTGQFPGSKTTAPEPAPEPVKDTLFTPKNLLIGSGLALGIYALTR